MESKDIEVTRLNSVTTRTIWGALIQTCQFGHFRIPGIKYISMNERLEILKDVKAPNGQWPFFKYWVIGDKGHINRIDGNDNESYIDEAKHHGDHAAPFRPIPFVLRPEGSDLTESERANYCLRRREKHDEKWYWAYYGKRIPGSEDAVPTVYLTSTKDGVSNTVEYETSTKNIYPTQDVIPPDQGLTTSSDVLTVSVPLTIDFSPRDAQELTNVARILYKGNEKRAVISEIGLCTGLDSKYQTTTDGGAQIMFNDAIQVWIAAFISTYQSLAFNNKGFTVELELGATEPVTTGTEVPDSEQMKMLDQNRAARLQSSGISATVFTKN